MKLKDLFSLAVKLGMENDPRSKAELDELLKKQKKAYDKMEEKEKRYFDESFLTNPYHDSRILHANDLNDEIKTILVGIDMEEPQLHLAVELNRRGEKIDLVLGHHPEGRALLGLGNEMLLIPDILEDCGIPINIAEKVNHPRKAEVDRGVNPINFIRPIHTAQLLGINCMNTHTISDNMVYQYLKRKVSKGKYRTVGDVVDDLMKEKEYQMAAEMGNPPIVVCGSKESRAGKVVASEITGGTSGSEDMYEKMSQAGVGTIIAMHMQEKHRKEAEKHHLNVIVAGHMASDSLGMNLLLDQFEKKGVKKVISCGMFRVKRK
ncbi:MAG: NGG1p interacting factor NIF3 [Candidatus Peregrinibacteria bacterium]